MGIEFYFQKQIWQIIKRMFASPKFKVIEPFGEMKFKENGWSGNISSIYSDRTIELNIRVKQYDEDLSNKIEAIKKWMKEYDSDLSKMHNAIFENYRNTKWSKTQQEIKKMYLLSSVTLNKSGSWDFILKPEKNIESVYNQFFLFTIDDGKIVWMNF